MTDYDGDNKGDILQAFSEAFCSGKEGLWTQALKTANSQFTRAVNMSEIIGSKIQYHMYILI